MEILPNDSIREIFLGLSDWDLNRLVRCSKLYRDIYGQFLEQRKKEQLESYLNKYAEKDPKLIQLITMLFNNQAPDTRYYRIVVPSWKFCSPNNSEFLFFKGNLSKALFKIADYLWTTVRAWDQNYRIKFNIFSEVFYRGDKTAPVNDLNDPEDMIYLFCEYQDGEIGIEEFYTLPQIQVI